MFLETQAQTRLERDPKNPAPLTTMGRWVLMSLKYVYSNVNCLAKRKNQEVISGFHNDSRMSKQKSTAANIVKRANGKQ